MRARVLVAVFGLAALAAGYGVASNHLPTAAAPPVPAGAYEIDKAHTSLLFRVSHMGFSHWTGRFTRVEAHLKFDPSKLTASSVTVTIDPRSIEADNAPPGFLEQLAGKEFLDADQFKEIAFRSTKVELTGPQTFRLRGDLTLHGVTKPVTLDARYNGGYAGHPMDPHARIGFSAHGTLKRSDFGVSFGIPAPGTTIGVGDEVEVILESELSGPPLTP
jgi:polyisoprenoid-binding protein YceI